MPVPGIEWRMGRSYRRRLLDAHLADVADALRGDVLEIGAGHAGRRGAFRPVARTTRWVSIDRRVAARPDVACDAARLPFPARAFDTVVCLEVLEYAEDPEAALAELARVLRPAGLLVLSMPFLHRWDTADDLWRASPAGLRRWLERSGFAVERSLAQGGALATAANILRYALWDGRSRGPLRTAAALLAAPLLELLFRADAAATRRRPELATFATGHLVLARRA